MTDATLAVNKSNKAQEKCTLYGTKVLIEQLITALTLFMPKTKAKMTVLIVIIIMSLVFLSLSNVYIAKLVGVCADTVSRAKKAVLSGSILHLFQRKEGSGRKIKTANNESEIIKEIEKGTYKTAAEIKRMIEDKFHISLCLTAVKNFLKRHNFRWLRLGSLPAKANPEAQRDFYEEKLNPSMQLALEDKLVLLFMDASHFIFGNEYICAIWCRVRRYFKTFSGRKRYNVLGAINFITKQVHTVTNDTYITATQICEMLDIIAETYIDKAVNIILDNAKYQKCKLVREHLDKINEQRSYKIELCYLPAYSPNLNLIERLWKWTKSKLSTANYSSFMEFQDQIDTILSKDSTVNNKEIDSLIGKKVQLFDEIEFINSMTAEINNK